MGVFLQRLGILEQFIAAVGTPQPDFSNITFMPDHENAIDQAAAFNDLAEGGVDNPHTFSWGGDSKSDAADSKFGSGTSLSQSSGSLWTGYSVDFTPTSAETRDTAEFCFEMHVKFNSIGFSQYFYTRYTTSGNQRSFYVSYDQPSAAFRFAGWHDGSTNLFVIDGTTAPVVDTWYHVAVTRQNGYSATPGSEDIIRLFVDGVKEGEFVLGTTEGLYNGTTYGPNVGNLGSGGGQLNGRIDNLRIVLDEPVYTEDFTPPDARHPRPPVVRIPFVDPAFANVVLLVDDGADASTAFVDLSETTKTLSASGNVKHDNAQLCFAGDTSSILFDGTNDGVNCGDHAEFDLPGDYGMDFWIYREAGDTGSRAISKYDFNSQRAFLMEIGDSGAQFNHYGDRFSSSSMRAIYGTGGPSLKDGSWHHIYVTHEDLGATMKGRMFIDGVLMSTTTNTDWPLDATSSPVWLGQDNNGNGDYQGRIAWPRIWKGEHGMTQHFDVPTGPPPLFAPVVTVVGVDGAAQGPTWDPYIKIPAGETGELLLAFLSLDQSTTPTPPTGWTQLFNTNWYDTVACFYRVTDGTEGTTADYSVGRYDRQCHVCFRLSGASGNVEYVMGTGADTLNPDPPSLTPSWGAKNNMWFTGVGFDHGSRSIDVLPTGYGNLTEYGHNLNHNGGADIALAYRLLNAASDDPSAFTMSSSSYNQVIPWTVAVEPA